jgi:hypothetical protein
VARLTIDQCVQLSVGQLADALKAEGPSALSETGHPFRFGFLMGVRRFLLDQSDREELERTLLLVMDDEQCATFQALKAVKR